MWLGRALVCTFRPFWGDLGDSSSLAGRLWESRGWVWKCDINMFDGFIMIITCSDHDDHHGIIQCLIVFIMIITCSDHDDITWYNPMFDCVHHARSFYISNWQKTMQSIHHFWTKPHVSRALGLHLKCDQQVWKGIKTRQNGSCTPQKKTGHSKSGCMTIWLWLCTSKQPRSREPQYSRLQTCDDEARGLGCWSAICWKFEICRGRDETQRYPKGLWFPGRTSKIFQRL